MRLFFKRAYKNAYQDTYIITIMHGVILHTGYMAVLLAKIAVLCSISIWGRYGMKGTLLGLPITS